MQKTLRLLPVTGCWLRNNPDFKPAISRGKRVSTTFDVAADNADKRTFRAERFAAWELVVDFACQTAYHSQMGLFENSESSRTL